MIAFDKIRLGFRRAPNSFNRKGLPAAILGAAAFLVMSAVVPASAETWRMASKVPPDSPEGRSFQVFADKVAEFSNGRLTVDVFPSEQLGGTEVTLEQLQAGLIHVYPEDSGFLQKWVPEVKWIGSEFIFDDRAHWSRFLETELVTSWFGKVEELAGISIIGKESDFVRGPYNVQASTRPWRNLSEMSGIKLRSHNNQLAVDIWTHLGADVRVLDWTDVYQSLDTGIVEAANSPIGLVEPMRFYEVAPHIIRHDAKSQGIAFMVNTKAYRGLDAELRDAVDRAQQAAGAYSADLMEKFAAESIERMTATGVEYYEIDNADFIERMAGFYRDLESEGTLPEGFLDAVASTR